MSRVLPVLLLLAVGCGGEVVSGADAPLRDKALDAREDHHWIYDGPLPPLERWRIRFSLRGHTARVTGLLPEGWDRPLPPYAVVEETPAGREVTVVYPVSTAGEGSANADPGRYRVVAGWTWTPSNVSGRQIPWGGFPYLEFDAGRAIAFHGPITAVDDVWRLQRGPVSHGCARMQGEHVVELAHLIGLDMGTPEDLGATFRVADPDWLVEVVADYDRVDGMVVDVDYPAVGGFERPAGADVRVFPSWSSDEQPRFVCAHEPERSLGTGHCAHQPAGTRSPVRPEDVGVIECPAPYQATPLGVEGAVLCVAGDRAYGPHTAEMLARCRAAGGGEACASDVWSLALTRATRGEGVCPVGASVDFHDTGYCFEGGDALGPFPRALVDACRATGGGGACDAPRWPGDRLRALAGLPRHE